MFSNKHSTCLMNLNISSIGLIKILKAHYKKIKGIRILGKKENSSKKNFIKFFVKKSREKKQRIFKKFV